jgi:hypothetical protein
MGGLLSAKMKFVLLFRSSLPVSPGNFRFNSGVFRKHRPGNASESRQNAPADPSASKLSADHSKTHAE